MTTERPLDDLLQPTLDAPTAAPVALYSPTVSFVAAFLGGPFAAIGIAAANSRLLRRLRADTPWLVGACVMTLLLVYLLYVPDGLIDDVGREGARILTRGYALALAAGGYWLHSRYHRNMRIMGLEPPRGWFAGAAAILLGMVALATAIWVVTR